MVVELPVIRVGRDAYFVDRRLNEIRNVKDVSDTAKLSDFELAFTLGKKLDGKAKGFRCRSCTMGFVRQRSTTKCPLCGSQEIQQEY